MDRGGYLNLIIQEEQTLVPSGRLRSQGGEAGGCFGPKTAGGGEKLGTELRKTKERDIFLANSAIPVSSATI